jgi:hypothetical protein
MAQAVSDHDGTTLADSVGTSKPRLIYSGDAEARSTGDSSLGRIRVAAMSTPMLVPSGLKAWARLSRRVADSSGPS